jgi:alpha-tubulin suppressor-like RCC1 family protein
MICPFSFILPRTSAMRSLSPRSVRTALPLGLLALLAACTDESSPLIAPPASESRNEIEVQALTCTVDVQAATVACVDKTGVPADSVSWARLATSNGGYAGGTLTFDVTVQNLLPQTMGVARSGEYDGAGVRVFFTQPPEVTSGTGTVTVNGAETGKFTRAGQLFYRYPQSLAPNQVSAPRQWSFSVPATVNTFRYTVRVAAGVQYPQGWVELPQGSVLRVDRGGTRLLKAVVRNALGQNVTATAPPVAWSVADSSVATVSGSTLTGAAVSGLSSVTATSGTLSASARVEVGAPFTQIAAGENHTCALASTGRAYCWGSNTYGQVGDNSYIDRDTPTRVATTLTFTQVTTGGHHTCALTAAGQAWCWGLNYAGELGDNSITRRTIPVAVQQGATAFVRIAAGEFSTCAQTSAGTWCWGSNGFGQLGTGTMYGNRLVPVEVQQRGFAYQDITAGRNHYCARESGRLVFCWGGNAEAGQLGDDSYQHRPAPVRVRQGTERFAQMTGGDFTSCALTPAGQAWCWGYNDFGQLGDNTDIGRKTPVAVQQGETSFVQISAGGYFACALTAAGQGWCWGYNGMGNLGNNSGLWRSLTPMEVQQGGAVFAEITTGFRHACARTPTGRAYCWGFNEYGQLGTDSNLGRPFPVPVVRAP